MYKRGDLNHISRTLRVLDELRGFRRGRLLSEIAAQLGASERTIRRDLADLRSAGFEIESLTIAGRAAARLVEKTYSNIAITRRERYTLLAIGSLFDVLRGTPLWEDVKSLQAKLAQRMSPEEREEHATFGERFAYVPDGGTKAYEGKEDVLDALLTGVLSRRIVRFAYRDARGRVRKGRIAPYTMVLYKHGLYVIGSRVREPGDREPEKSDGRAAPEKSDGRAATEPLAPIVVYAVERFTEADALRNAPFTVPAGFQIAGVLNGAFGIHVAGPDAPPRRVVIEFSAAKAAFVRARIWHPTQTFEELPDGRVRLAFTCASLIPVVSWVLEWGPHARAIEPPELVADVIAELDAARRGYDAPPEPAAAPAP
ncbi:MAG TPA: transcriptional regulator [Kofleriaceae bacterium]|nr:transcriptional regulator [Kofleriaceae bacterium]